MAKQKKVGEPKTQQGYFEKYMCFSIVNNDKTGGKTMLALGNYLLPTKYDTPAEAKSAILNKDWNLLIDAISVVCQLIKKIEEDKQ